MQISGRLLAVIGLASILSACGSGASTPSTQAAAPANGATSPMQRDFPDHHCLHNGRLKLNPCAVKLTVSNPTATVMATGRPGGTITYKDNDCTKKAVATLSGSDGTYLVTAGVSAGRCVARFKDKSGQKVGRAILYIVNKV